MIKFWDCEGERIVTITDRDYDSSDVCEELKGLNSFHQEVKDAVGEQIYDAACDTPFFINRVSDDADIEGIETKEQTFEEFVSELKEWGEKCFE